MHDARLELTPVDWVSLFMKSWRARMTA